MTRMLEKIVLRVSRSLKGCADYSSPQAGKTALKLSFDPIQIERFVLVQFHHAADLRFEVDIVLRDSPDMCLKEKGQSDRSVQLNLKISELHAIKM